MKSQFWFVLVNSVVKLLRQFDVESSVRVHFIPGCKDEPDGIPLYFTVVQSNKRKFLVSYPGWSSLWCRRYERLGLIKLQNKEQAISEGCNPKQGAPQTNQVTRFLSTAHERVNGLLLHENFHRHHFTLHQHLCRPVVILHTFQT
jgi:hypothetical protein